MIPRHLHYENFSMLVEWEALPVRVTTGPEDWPQDSGRPRRAGVSAFGISGVNAHVVLEGYGPANGTSTEGNEDIRTRAPH